MDWHPDEDRDAHDEAAPQGAAGRSVPSRTMGRSSIIRCVIRSGPPPGGFRYPRRGDPWVDVCRPRKAVNINTLAAMFVLGWVMVILMRLAWFDDGSSREENAASPPGAGLAPSGNGVVKNVGPAGDSRTMREEHLDKQAQQRAEARRLETERRLAQANPVMVWRLADWRFSIAMLQDLMVRLAGTATDGSRIGHEICRNDLALEVELLEPYAEPLAAIRADDAGSHSAAPDEVRRRAEVWHSVWEQLETMAKVLRESGRLNEIGEENLAKTLREAGGTHRSLAVMIGNLEDDEAAWAVISFCNAYLSSCFSPITHEFFPGQPGRAGERDAGA